MTLGNNGPHHLSSQSSGPSDPFSVTRPSRGQGLMATAVQDRREPQSRCGPNRPKRPHRLCITHLASGPAVHLVPKGPGGIQPLPPDSPKPNHAAPRAARPAPGPGGRSHASTLLFCGPSPRPRTSVARLLLPRSTRLSLLSPLPLGQGSADRSSDRPAGAAGPGQPHTPISRVPQVPPAAQPGSPRRPASHLLKCSALPPDLRGTPLTLGDALTDGAWDRCAAK
ncbi:hypothetical protein NDU88_010588 [Pleurodeles waltl]|uniref:Uncharacterized protein n=1 Tax=Pleurodeles waltl TaxID=8319 RepID=A0AAV7PYD1_PLEWA|nr:hypothetical protein NDU88_010588 [Pleurodeles waltl]